jgi:hypothetical protein
MEKMKDEKRRTIKARKRLKQKKAKQKLIKAGKVPYTRKVAIASTIPSFLEFRNFLIDYSNQYK